MCACRPNVVRSAHASCCLRGDLVRHRRCHAPLTHRKIVVQRQVRGFHNYDPTGGKIARTEVPNEPHTISVRDLPQYTVFGVAKFFQQFHGMSRPSPVPQQHHLRNEVCGIVRRKCHMVHRARRTVRAVPSRKMLMQTRVCESDTCISHPLVRTRKREKEKDTHTYGTHAVSHRHTRANGTANRV